MGQPLAALVCPKCQGAMRQYERSGVIIDQCADCRGIFLDRGELERLIEAEDVHYGNPAPQQQQQPPPPPPGYGYQQDPYYQGGGKHGGYDKHGGRRKRGGFLGDLFD